MPSPWARSGRAWKPAGTWRSSTAASHYRPLLVLARRNPPAVIFIDLQLRDVPGGQAVGWLRSNPALGAVPIVLIASGTEDDAEIASIHPAALLRKPVSRGAVERIAVGLQNCRA